MIPPDVELAEFFKIYRAEQVSRTNRTKVLSLCGVLISEERDEFFEAREKLKTLDDDSDEWFPALAHCFKELTDMEYVNRYTGHANRMEIKPIYKQHYRWTLTGACTFDVLNDLNVLLTLPVDHEIEEDRLRLLQEHLGVQLSAIRQTAYDLGGSPETYKQMFDLTHWSNLNKEWDDGEYHYDPKTGKLRKPPGFVGPEAEIEAILRETVTETSKIG